MRYFDNTNNILFSKQPISFDKYTDKNILKYAIGANMYMPGIQNNIVEKLLKKQFSDVGAITLCLEDAINEENLEEAEENVLNILDRLYGKSEDLPLIFIRVRSVEQFKSFSLRLDKNKLSVLCGFNFPKFNSENGNKYFEILKQLSNKNNEILYGLPILEDSNIVNKETRIQELNLIQDIFTTYDDYLLNIRVGATDFSSLFGLRRNKNTTVYDIRVVSDCLIDILNFFLRKDKDYVISGPVWEYYSWNENNIENITLKKELELDIQNGFHGKTIIHPSQIKIVNEAYIVDCADYKDALSILNINGGGVFRSTDGNRMNESKPHSTWAKRIIAKAEIFGVKY